MSQESEKLLELKKLESALEEGLQAIDFITQKLINLAVLESQFIKQVAEVQEIGFLCNSRLQECKLHSDSHADLVKRQKNYFQFRYRWMERLFIKWRM